MISCLPRFVLSLACHGSWLPRVVTFPPAVLNTLTWLLLRLGDVLVDDVAGETLLFFLLPHEQDTLMNEDVLFL